MLRTGKEMEVMPVGSDGNYTGGLSLCDMYTLKETQQIIRENPYTIMFPTKEYTLLEDIMEILESTDNTRTFTITSKLNTEDYSYPATDYYITERR
jgi:hypothetical protein